MLPESLRTAIARHLERVKLLHEKDLAAGLGRVYLPFALQGSTRRRIGNGAGNMFSRRQDCPMQPAGTLA
jgi:hypothetical protein